MCRVRSDVWSVLAVLVAGWPASGVALGVVRVVGEPVVGKEADARVVGFLTDRGLDDLLGAYWRGRLSSGDAEERTLAAETLGRLYAGQLAAAVDGATRRAVEERCRELLQAMPDADTFELRITLAKTTYLKAEEIAERDRLRLTTAEEREEAVRILEASGAAFKDIAAKVHRRAEALERSAEVAKDERVEEIRARLDEARRLRSLARYYAGWSDLYLGVMTSRPAAAQSAIEQFGWLLGAAEGKAPTVERMPKSLLKYEHIARASLGVAMAHAAKGNGPEAVRWLDAVEGAEGLSPGLAEQLAVRRLGVLMDAGQWTLAEDSARRMRVTDGRASPLKAGVARLVVVSGLEYAAKNAGSSAQGESARRCARAAMNDLVALGEIGQVLDLAKRYGESSIEGDGFVPAYVRAVRAYERAREDHRKAEEGAGGAAGEEPTREAGVMGSYEKAGELFEAAEAAKDAGSFGASRWRASSLRGMCLYYSGRLVEAADRFQMVAESDAGEDQRREAMWYAVLSLDRAAERDGSLAERRDRLATLYVSTYPTSENAARLLMRRGGIVSVERAAEILLGVDRSSPVYLGARRQAARLLYQSLRSATGKERDFAAQRFAAVAEEVLDAEMARSVSDVSKEAAAEAARTGMLYGRQIADAVLSTSAPDTARAEAALAKVERLASLHSIPTGDIEAELTFRRVQIALGKGDEAAARALLDRLGGEKSEYAKAADRLLYRRAWEAFEGTGREEAARRVIEYGRRLLGRLEREGLGPQDSATAAVMDGIAAAAFSLRGLEEPLGRVALGMDERLLSAGVRTAGVLRRHAVMSESAGNRDEALASWRELVQALPRGVEGWYEARYESIRLLAEKDPAAAREVMDQHKALEPAMGPGTWGEKFRELDAKLAGGGR